MENYRYCTECKSVTPHRYDFTYCVWQCHFCGADLSKPENSLTKPGKIKNGKRK